MKVLVIGGGGREHSLIWKLKQSPNVESVWCTPGNGGIEADSDILTVASSDHAQLIEFCLKAPIDLIVVGPEAPLCNGIADDMRAAGLTVFGPGRAAALRGGAGGAGNGARVRARCLHPGRLSQPQGH